MGTGGNGYYEYKGCLCGYRTETVWIYRLQSMDAVLIYRMDIVWIQGGECVDAG